MAVKLVDGAIAIYKPKGLTSHDIIEKIRHFYRFNAGHAGTLDPMAQGVLVVFFGKALKILSFLPAASLDKTYLMRVTLGTTTDTYDSTGNVVDKFQGKIDMDSETLLKTFRKFIGEIEQTPPAFSAVKIDGKRAYELARSGKIPVIASRKVYIYSIRLVKDFFLDGSRNLLLRVHCGRGTYVRSIAYDLGKELGCGAHLSYLLRERVGIFTSAKSYPVWKIEKKEPFWESDSFLPLNKILPFPSFFVGKDGEIRIQKGQPLSFSDLNTFDEHFDQIRQIEENPVFQIFSEEKKLLAIYKPEVVNKDEKICFSKVRLFPARVFALE
ncbi:MAG: tRNA pseudouridine(55) synthase TruB [Candidatus Riflebacteria bacterium]|nr:tRNA pseudouridine(55) synthase TruB [Candidatus Riflebacteria bacterium]